MDAVDAEDRKQADDNLSLRVSNELLGLRDKDSARIGALEGQLTTLLGVVEALQRRLDQRDNQLEVSKSEALLEQQAAIADAVLNAAAVETSLRNQTVASQAAHDQQAIESRAQLEAQATAIDALRGTVSSTTQLMAERGNAVVDQLATAESRQARLGVQLTELEGQADAIGNPITRPEIQALVTDAVTAEWKAQQPALVDAAVDEVRDQFPAGLGGQRVDSARTRQLRDDANRFKLEATS